VEEEDCRSFSLAGDSVRDREQIAQCPLSQLVPRDDGFQTDPAAPSPGSLELSPGASVRRLCQRMVAAFLSSWTPALSWQLVGIAFLK